MVALSPSRRQVVHDCIATALREIIGGDSAGAYVPPHDKRLHTRPSSGDGKALGHAVEIFSKAVAALRCVFDVAVSCVSEEWNANHRDALISLPMELVTECFRWLEPDDCISASHVSRSWRHAALADCWLWNEYDIPEEPRSIDTEVHALSTLLSRSHPAPFAFTCYLPASFIPDAVYELVGSNLHRMVALEFTGRVEISRILRADAFQLKSLIFDSVESFESCVFPPGWGSGNAPHLQQLAVSNFALPSDTLPFAALLALQARLSPGRIPDISFSAVFPNLTRLDLRPMSQAMVPKLTPLPPSLEHVSLVGGVEQVDYSPIFRAQAVPSGIRQLKLQRAAGFQAALALFVRVCPGRWKLQFNGDNRIVMNDISGAMSWRISCWDALSLAGEEGFTDHLGQLGELELPLDALIDLHRVPDTVWDRALPALRSLRLAFPRTCVPDDWQPIARDCVSDAFQGLSMPALRSVELLASSGPPNRQCDCMFVEWLRRDAPLVMARLFSSAGAGSPAASAKPIERIVIRRGSDIKILRGDVACLLQLADRVLVGTSGDSEDLELMFEARSPPSACE